MVDKVAWDNLGKMRSIIQRRDEFSKMRPWLRRFLIMKYESELFPDTWEKPKVFRGANRRIKNEASTNSSVINGARMVKSILNIFNVVLN